VVAVAVQSPSPVRRSPGRRRSTSEHVARHGTPAQPQTAAPAVEPAARTTAPHPGASGWGGTAVLVVPTAGLFAIVAVIVAVNEVNRWWTLAFAMVFVIVATLCVVATIGRMLGGEDE
jgi:hypothetical protein